MGEENIPGRQEMHPPRRPLEERHAELVLQAADRPRERRLRYMKLTRRAADVALLGDGDEVPDLREAHESRLPRRREDGKGLVVRYQKSIGSRAPAGLILRRMAIALYGSREQAALRRAGQVAAETLAFVASKLKPGISTADIVSGIQHPAVQYIGRKEEAVDYLLDRIRPGDVVLTLGAGDSDQVGEGLLESLRKRVETYRP